MITLFVKLISFIFLSPIIIIGFLLLLFFIFIPTMLLDPSEQIPYIEKDLCINFPEDYSVIDKYEDWLGFEQHQEITFKFGAEEFKILIYQITGSICENGEWAKRDEDTYIFNLNKDFASRNDYFFEADVSINQSILNYSYSNY